MFRKLLPLIGGIVALTAVVMGLLAWAVFGGETGRQRGLVVRNQISEPVTISLEDGQSAEVATGRQTTFVLEREDFPQFLTATDISGVVVVEQDVSYAELAEAEFRIDVDRAGVHPTQVIRTVVP